MLPNPGFDALQLSQTPRVERDMSLAASCRIAAVRTRPPEPARGPVTTCLQPATRQLAAVLRWRQSIAPAGSSSSRGDNGTPAAATAAATDVEKQIELLRQACRTKKVPPEEVLAAMQAVQVAHSQQPLVQGALGGSILVHVALNVLMLRALLGQPAASTQPAPPEITVYCLYLCRLPR